LEKLKSICLGLDAIVEKGGFKFKGTIMSGDSMDGPDDLKKVLGQKWNTQQDRILVDIKVNYGGKKKGAKIEEDADLGAIEESTPQLITRRIVWQVAQSQYDLLGLLSVYLIKLKLLMRDLSLESGQVAAWDEAIPDGIKKDFMAILMDMKALKEITFPRSIKPASWDIMKKPILMVFGDGSIQAYCTLAYVRWDLEDGTAVCRLLCRKTRVAPKMKISVPRMELMGALLAVRLAKKIKDSLRIEFESTYFFTDSSVVLGMLQCNSQSFLEFMGTRVSEIKSKSDVETEWNWIPTDCNLADMGTRTDVKPSDMMEDSDYQLGMPWMRLPVEEWPAKKDVNKQPPTEEMRKTVVLDATCNVVVRQETMVKYSGSYSKLLRIWGYVFTFINKSKNMKVEGLQVAIKKNGQIVHSSPSPEMLYAAEDFLVEEAQKNLVNKKLESLMPLKKNFKDLLGIQRTYLVVGECLVKKLNVGYDKDDLPILDYQHPLANMIMEDTHCQDHGGQNNAVLRSRKLVWIIRARKLAMKIKNNCFRCKLLYRKTMEQKMSPIPDHRLGPAPIFHSTAPDLFGPLQIRDAVKKRTTGKCWGVLFTCTATTAV
jgi:hypothetical protein